MSNHKRMLLVSDDMVEMDSLPYMYARFGIDLVMVASFKEALDELNKGLFDFIMTDISLDGSRTGIELVCEIRKTGIKTKVAVATGYGEEYRESAMKAGADFYFQKPLDFEEHVLVPLGINRDNVERPGRGEYIAHADKDKITLRRAMHDIANSNNLTIMVSGLLKEATQNFIAEKQLTGDAKEFLQRVMDDVSDIEEAGKKADALLKHVRESVYNKLNADELTVE